mgnify:FL=1
MSYDSILINLDFTDLFSIFNKLSEYIQFIIVKVDIMQKNYRNIIFIVDFLTVQNIKLRKS